jgi:hypothetical protein
VGWWSSDDPRRRAAFVAAVLVASAVVGLGVGTLLGVTGNSGTDTATSTSTPGTASKSATPSATGRPTTRSASEIDIGTTSDIGYLLGSRTESDGTHVTFDRVLLKTGKDARKYAKANHKVPPGPGGVLLVNNNNLTRDLVLAPDVAVVGTQQLAGSSTPEPVTVQTLLERVASHGAGLLLDLTYDKLGYVTKVREHDLP